MLIIKIFRKNELKKLLKSDLKRINGGNPPDREANTIEYYYSQKTRVRDTRVCSGKYRLPFEIETSFQKF